MKLWPPGSRVRWTTYGPIEGAGAGDVHHGAVVWSRLMPASPGAIVELVAVLRRLRREGVRPLPRAAAALAVGRGVLVDVRDYRGKRRILTPWMRRLQAEPEVSK